MNGQMYQIACIVAAARKALKSGKEICYKPEKYTNKLSFQILPSKNGEATELSVSDWFENLKEKGLKDLKLFCPICQCFYLLLYFLLEKHNLELRPSY